MSGAGAAGVRDVAHARHRGGRDLGGAGLGLWRAAGADVVPLPAGTLAGQEDLSEKGQEVATDRRPNILFIMSDDHGKQAIGSYGSCRLYL